MMKFMECPHAKWGTTSLCIFIFFYQEVLIQWNYSLLTPAPTLWTHCTWDSQEGLLQPLLIVTSFFPLSWHHLCLSRTPGSAKHSPAGRKMGVWVVLGSLEGRYFSQEWRAARRRKEHTSLMGPIDSFFLKENKPKSRKPWNYDQ